jgi:hypothetical protein
MITLIAELVSALRRMDISKEPQVVSSKEIVFLGTQETSKESL